MPLKCKITGRTKRRVQAGSDSCPAPGSGTFSAYFQLDGKWWLDSFGIPRESVGEVITTILRRESKCTGVKAVPTSESLAAILSNDMRHE